VPARRWSVRKRLVTGVGPQDLDFLDKQPVEGPLLADRLADGALPAEEALLYAIDIGNTLKKAHDRGIVHGCLSPYAIRLTEAGAVILEPTSRGALKAAAYRAPEQVRGEQPDTRSDVYAFGALVYEMAAGSPAFLGEGADLNRSILNDPPPTLTLRSPIYSAMASVIVGCLDKNPGTRRQRIQNAVIELRFANKGAARSAGARPVPPVRPAPPPEALVGEAPIDGSPLEPPVLDTIPEPEPVPAPRPQSSLRSGGRKRPSEPPRAEQFFFRPGEPVVRMRATLEPVGWRALFQPDGKLSLSSFPVRLVGFIAACLVVVGALVFGVVVYFKPHSSAPVLKYSLNAPENTSFPGLPAVSPDGRNLAFSAQGPEGKRTLWLRPLDAERSTAINNTEGATNPFWSPDGQSLGYFAQGTLRIVRLKDQSMDVICKAEGTNGGGAWSKDNTILYSRSIDDGLFRVAGKPGSAPEAVIRVRPDKGENGYLWPQFLPDGSHFIFFVQTESAESTGVYAGSLDSGDYHLLIQSETNAVYSALPESSSRKIGYLLYIMGRKLMGQAFNASKLGVSGEPMTLADDIGAVRSLFLAPITVANNATMIYQTIGKPTRQMAWFDRAGNQITSVRDAGEWGPPRIAPDGHRAIAAKLPIDSDAADLWVIDLGGGASQLTTTSTHEGAPVFSPDGSRIVSFINGKQEGNYDLYVRPLDPNGRADLLFHSAQPKYPTDWSRDGRYILFNVISDSTKYDVWAVSTADRRAGPILDTVNIERDGVLSPDGKWLAYDSDESGRNEVYVQAFTGIDNSAKRRWKISATGAALPKWRGDGKELFFMTASGRIMATTVHPGADVFDFDPPAKVFQTRPIPKAWNFFDVTSDGQKFLVNLPIEWAGAAQFKVVTNWTELLKE
jgi:Tol biopolymer transport system component